MIGQRLGSFLLDAKIGSGAMGEVFRATQTLKDGRTRIAAVKVVSADFLERENALRRFQREAEILAQLRHPNIVRYYAHGKFQGTYYYAMEYVEGETLDDVLERREYLPWREVVSFGIQLCQALQYAHEHQVVHRDLKPSNLMVTADSRIKLTDFGIAKDLDATVALTRTGRTLGTAAYMAPEQIRGTPGISHKTDLYALGCLLFQMLTGKPPFEGRSAVVLMHAHISEEPPRPSSKNPEVPKALDDLVVELMAKEPPDRPWDAAQVAHLLEQLRDRADRGDTVPMAFDRGRAQVADESHPISGAIRTAPAPGTRQRSRKARKATAGSAAVEGSSTITRQRVETALLAMTLLGLVGLVAYILWPPGAEYLHRKAAEVMVDGRRAEWPIAKRKYIDPLKERFPAAYSDDVQDWLVMIALDDAEGRAKYLAGGMPGANEPRNYAESGFKEAYLEAERLKDLDQWAAVAGLWQKYVQDLEGRGDPDEVGWLALGHKRLDQVEQELRRQRETAVREYAQARAAILSRQFEPARVLLESFVERYAGPAAADPVLARQLRDVQAELPRIRAEIAHPSSADEAIVEPSPAEPSETPSEEASPNLSGEAAEDSSDTSVADPEDSEKFR